MAISLTSTRICMFYGFFSESPMILPSNFAHLKKLCLTCLLFFVGDVAIAAIPSIKLERPESIQIKHLKPEFSISNSEISESSGVAMSLRYPGWLWTHNDSGDLPRLFLFAGSTIAETESDNIRTAFIAKQSNQDWEDLCMGDDGYLYVGSFGNNEKKREVATLLRLKEPEFQKSNVLVEAERIDFKYRNPISDHRRSYVRKDCEALCQWDDGLLLFTKRLVAEESDVYLLPDVIGYPAKREPLDALFLKRLNGIRGVTGAASWNRGDKVALLTYWSIWVFERDSNMTSDFWENPLYMRINAGQCEAICFLDANRLLLTNESQEVFVVDIRSFQKP
jgi:hypothetical protein